MKEPRLQTLDGRDGARAPTWMRFARIGIAPARALALAITLVLPVRVSLEAAQPPDGLARTQVGQQQLQSTTQRVASQLDGVIDEFQRNGLTGEDLQLLISIRSVVGQLTDDDMARVVELIGLAREGPETSERRSRLMEAFSTQKTVGLKLRQILLEYQRQQELAAVAARLEELASRQNVTMRDTLTLAESAAGRRREWFSENQRISLQLQMTEQQSLRDEVASVLERLRTWSDETDNDAAARAAAAVEQPSVARLAHALETTVLDLEGSRLLSATGRQRSTRRLLRVLARSLIPAADELEQLQSALSEVKALIARQGEARNVTRELGDRPAAWQEISSRQGEMVDDTDILREQIQRLDTASSEQVSAAIGRMQEARGVLTEGVTEWRSRRTVAGTQQELALARLESARRLLQERIDSLEKQREATADPVSNLQQVRDDVAELIEREKELKADAAPLERDPASLRPIAPRQGDLGDRTSDAAARAAMDSQEAAEQINEGAAQMRKSQRSLGEGRNDPGSQQAAIDALSKALETLDKRLAELAAAEKELAELQDLLARLIALIEAQQLLNGETALLARKVPGRAPGEVSVDQGGLASVTKDLAGEVPPSVPRATAYLGEASTQMGLAGGELAAARVVEARPPQDEALANLLRAKLELEERIAQLQEMLGLPTDQASLEELAQRIKEAQQDVNSALSEEALQSMAQNLDQAGRKIRPATSGRLGRLPKSVRDPLQKADKSLNEGAASAQGGDQPGAEGEAASAQEALAAAAAALDLAMAGMGQQPGNGQGQGQGEGQGQGQGRGRGKMPGSQAGKGTGDGGNFFGAGGGNGPRRSVDGSGRFIGLPARERAALLQSQGETYPQEYAPMIEQYLKNLSDQVGEAPR